MEAPWFSACECVLMCTRIVDFSFGIITPKLVDLSGPNLVHNTGLLFSQQPHGIFTAYTTSVVQSNLKFEHADLLHVKISLKCTASGTSVDISTSNDDRTML